MAMEHEYDWVFSEPGATLLVQSQNSTRERARRAVVEGGGRGDDVSGGGGGGEGRNSSSGGSRSRGGGGSGGDDDGGSGSSRGDSVGVSDSNCGGGDGGSAANGSSSSVPPPDADGDDIAAAPTSPTPTRMLHTQLRMVRSELSRCGLAYLLCVAFPLLTWRVQALIHLEAFALWWKGVPLFPHPTGATNGFVRVVEALMTPVMLCVAWLSGAAGAPQQQQQRGDGGKKQR